MAAVRPANVVRERGACTPAQRRHARDGFDPEYAGADDEHHPPHDPPCRTASWRWDGATITALLPCRQPFNLGAPPPVRSAAVGGVENTALTIADLGKATNTKVKTTGYYPRIGPLPKPIRCAGNYRTNGVDEMGCRSFIRRTHDLGLSLDQVFALVDSSDDRACDCPGIGPIANERLQHVDREPADLPALRRELKVSSISVAAAPLPNAGSSKRWAHYRQ